jgi:hypothetical protein
MNDIWHAVSYRFASRGSDPALHGWALATALSAAGQAIPHFHAARTAAFGSNSAMTATGQALLMPGHPDRHQTVSVTLCAMI